MRSAMTSVRQTALLLALATLSIATPSAQEPWPVLLTITGPAAGTAVSPGEAIVVTVAALGTASVTRAEVIGEQPFGMSGTPVANVPAQFTFTVPARIASRRFTFTAIGTTSAGQTIRSESIEVDVERAGLPGALSTLMPTVTMGVTGEESPVVLLATFPDNTVVDVTRSSRVSYQVVDPNIATVDSNGIITAVRSGSTSLTATYSLNGQSIRMTVPVTVKSQALNPSAVAMSFGEQGVGTVSAAQALTITNTANGAVRIFGIATGDEFIQTHNCPIDTPIAEGASCVVSVAFRPAATGARSGSLEIAGSAHVVPALIPLSGTGTGVADAAAPVTTSDVQPQANAGGWHRADVTVTLAAADSGPGSSGVQQITYSASGAQTIASTTVSGAAASIALTTEGSTTLTFSAADVAGNVEAAKTLPIKIDRTMPIVTCGAADGVWHPADVNVSCSASDALSGLLNASDSSVSLTTSVAPGIETALAETGSRTICDVAGNCATAGPVSGIKVDKRGPSIAVAVPESGANYVLGQAITAAYSCTDAGSGLASCSGAVASGASLDTAAVGPKTLTVNAADAVGNTSTASAAYTVTYASTSCLSSPGRQILAPIRTDGTTVVKRGSTVPAKFRVCDAAGASIGTPGVVSSFALVSSQAAPPNEVNAPVLSATPDTAFRWDPVEQLWIFNISTDNLAVDTAYVYRITLNDGTLITFSFGVK